MDFEDIKDIITDFIDLIEVSQFKDSNGEEITTLSEYLSLKEILNEDTILPKPISKSGY